MKNILPTLLLLFLFSCSSHKKTNKLAVDLSCPQHFSFYFTYDHTNSSKEFRYSGETQLGTTSYPNFIEEFERSVKDLNQATSFEMRMQEHALLPEASVKEVHVTIRDIIWHFKKNQATMSIALDYEVEGKLIKVIGENTVFVAATKKGNFFKCLKNGHYQFFERYCLAMK
jgi:hypothetical protein